jgi:putative membrane protein
MGLISLSAGGAAAVAQTGSQPSAADKHFVKAALRGGMAEVKLGQLAAEKGSSDDVKTFGQKMVDDHTKLGEQMKTVAGQIGVTPPTVLSPADLALEAKLKMLSGDAFDKAYIGAMVKDHQEDLNDFKKEISTASSSTVKDAAEQGEKVISKHLEMIQKIAQQHQVASN